MLERRYHHHARIVAKDVFGAIAMMHIEIYDRDPLQTMRFERVRGTDRDIVEEAKAHRTSMLSVMTRWTHAAERVRHFFAEHQVSTENRCSGGMQSGAVRMGVHRGVGIQVHNTGLGRGGFDFINVRRIVHPNQLIPARGGSLVLAQQAKQPRGDKLILDGAQALGRLGVIASHIVQLALRMGDVRGLHARYKLTILRLCGSVC